MLPWELLGLPPSREPLERVLPDRLQHQEAGVGE